MKKDNKQKLYAIAAELEEHHWKDVGLVYIADKFFAGDRNKCIRYLEWAQAKGMCKIYPNRLVTFRKIRHAKKKELKNERSIDERGKKE